MNALRKFWRYVTIYGLDRTISKAAGRLRVRVPRLSLRRVEPDIGIIGCGQFAFASIGYFLQKAFGPRIRSCYDVDPKVQATFAKALAIANQPPDADALLADPQLRTVYIASNHASHADYAMCALARGLDVYVEKPIAVTEAQLSGLLRAIAASRGRIFSGYNRPYSGAIRRLRDEMTIDPTGGFSMQCFVSGHHLALDHWYHRPEEGTRICGNVGHWLDLFVHILRWRSLPDELDVTLAWADDREPDDNCSITICSAQGDIFSVMLASRSEPFEGINETIQLQHASTICKIDDFRALTIWRGEQVVTGRFWPKDVGHRLAILQPFGKSPVRDWQEVVQSTLLMLHITDMVRQRRRHDTFSFSRALDRVARLS
jgi:predicted dehydrogenase